MIWLSAAVSRGLAFEILFLLNDCPTYCIVFDLSLLILFFFLSGVVGTVR